MSGPRQEATGAADTGFVAPVGPLPREARVEAIRHCLEAVFAPELLEVIDDSHKHAGHAGARDGRGHFRVRIVSPAFAGLSPLARHRAVYAALGGLMETDIHALSIQAGPPA
jgi:BolA protein